jgi:hypothetical protein
MSGQLQINSPIKANLVSQTLGRIRIRLAPSHRQNQTITYLVSALQQKLAIYRIRANVYSGSITIFYGQEHLDFEDICHFLEDLGVVIHEFVGEAKPIDTRYSKAAFTITKIASNLNQDVNRSTSRRVDLRFLFSFSLGLLALRQLLVKGLQLEVIPWYVLAWYAFDSFIKLHRIDEL